MSNITIAEAIQDIDLEIDDLLEQKHILQALNVNEVVTEQNWHKICHTSLRTSDIMEKLCKNIFPEAEDIKVGCNYVSFVLYDFNCYIPTSNITGIEVDLSWFKKLKKPKLDDFETRECIKLRNLLNASTDEEKMDILMPHIKNKYKKALLWNIQHKPLLKQYEDNYYELVGFVKNQYEKALEQYNVEFNNQKMKIELLKYTLIPKLNTFTSRINAHHKSGFINIKVDEVLSSID